MRISDWSSDVCSSDLHKPPREGFEVVIFHAVVGADNDAELVPITFCRFQPGLAVNRVAVRAIEMPPRPVARRAVALDLTKMRSEERRVGQECVRTCRSRWSPYY